MKTQLFILLLSLSFVANAQVGINNTDPKASLDITASNVSTPSNTDGILIPRVDDFPVTNPTANQDGMLVFATGVGTPSKGFYYWSQNISSWVSFAGIKNTLDQAYDEGGAGAGRTITATDGAVTINGEDGILITGTLGSGDVATAANGVKMFFNPRTASFRAGSLTAGTMGDYSTAMGFNVIASGVGASSLGSNGTASGDYSFSTGYNNDATATGAMALGYSTDATGLYSFSSGQNTSASGNHSFAMGNSTTASGDKSFVMGVNSNATGNFSVAMGSTNTASAPSSMVFGNSNISSGNYSTTFGFQNTSPSYAETTLGHYATEYVANSTSGFNNADKLFSIGNGIADASRSNALTIYKNGLLNINDEYNMPLTDGTANYIMKTNGAGQVSFVDPATIGDGDTQNTLDQAYDEGGAGAGRTITATDGAVTIAGEDGFTVIGTLNSGDAIGVTGAGTRMFFNPNKAAFRAGQVNGTQWDNVNIGERSSAFGNNNIASGSSSSAFGANNTSSGFRSFSIGELGIASGQNSITIGDDNNATASNTFAHGYRSTASANASVAMGLQNNAPSWSEMTVGAFATTYSANSTVGWHTNDRLFTIGNGAGPSTRSNALTIYKNGLLNINDEYNMPLTDGTANYIMKTNGAGQVSFVDPATIGDGTGTDSQTIDTFNFNTGTNILTLEVENDGVAAQTVDLSSLAGVSSNNGLNTDAGIVQMGGSLTEVTTVALGANNLIFDINSSGDLSVNNQNAPVNGTQFTVDSNGITSFGGDVQWNDGNTSGTILASLTDSDNDALFQLYENGLATVILETNTGYVFNELGFDRNFRVESNNRGNMFFVDGGQDRIGIGTGAPSNTLHVVGDARITTLAGTNSRLVTSNSTGVLNNIADGANNQLLTTNGAGAYTWVNSNSVGTDSQTIDTFSFDDTTNEITLEVENDGIAAQTVDLSILDTGGDITEVIAGDGLVGGGNTGSVTLHVVGTNGLTDTANAIGLGGTLLQDTTINLRDFDMHFQFDDSSTKDFKVFKEFGRNLFTAGNDGYIKIGNPYVLDEPRLQVTGGATLGKYMVDFHNPVVNQSAAAMRIRVGAPNTIAFLGNFISFFKEDGANIMGSIEGTAGGGVNYSTVSDKRLKIGINDISNSLELINKIQPRIYEYKANKGAIEYGFIAQELQAIYPQAVSGTPDSDVKTNPMMVDYGRLTPLLTAGIKELNEKVEKLEKENQNLKQQLSIIEVLEARLTVLENNTIRPNLISEKK